VFGGLTTAFRARSFGVGSLAAIVLLGLAPKCVNGQEVGAFALAGRSGHPEIGASTGFGGVLTFPMGYWVKLRLVADTRTGKGVDRIGVTCLDTQRAFRCGVREPIISETRMQALTVAVTHAWRPVYQLRLTAGGGVTVAQTDLVAFGESGQEALVINPATAHPGFAALAEAAWQPLRALPAMFWIGTQSRFLFLDGCDRSGERYQAFCGRELFTDILAGVSATLVLR